MSDKCPALGTLSAYVSEQVVSAFGAVPRSPLLTNSSPCQSPQGSFSEKQHPKRNGDDMCLRIPFEIRHPICVIGIGSVFDEPPRSRKDRTWPPNVGDPRGPSSYTHGGFRCDAVADFPRQADYPAQSHDDAGYSSKPDQQPSGYPYANHAMRLASSSCAVDRTPGRSNTPDGPGCWRWDRDVLTR
jgi:hypothetical protein